jgi:hypothetical protein
MSEFHGPTESRKLRERLEGQDLAALSAADEDAVQKRMAAIDKLFYEVKAKYKIEVQLNELRSTWKPFSGVMSFFMNGNRLHGGGDSKVYLCSDTRCYGPIDAAEASVVNLDEDPDQINPVKVLCSKCKRIQPASELWGERFLCLTPNRWADALVRNFKYLDSNADLCLTLHHSEIQSLTKQEMDRPAGGEVIQAARRCREKVVYPLKNIIKDTVNGSELYSRFLAFIKES